MDSNGCDTNHLDARLPPRKRLLAGLKKQSFSESTSQCSQGNHPSPSLSPSIVQSPLSEFDIRLNNLLKSYKNNGSNMSPEDIALAAKSAAEAAAKAAEVARVVAEGKAAIAAKAVAAAKSALDLVPFQGTSRRDKQKKRKLKNHLPVEVRYEEYQPSENCGADEELARRLHRSMNSSARISRHSPGSSSRTHKHKKLKMSNGDAERGVDCEGSVEENVNEVFESSKINEGDVDSSEAESIHPKEKTVEGFSDLSVNGRKRGRIRQKRLSLSICSSKEELTSTSPSLSRETTEKLSAAHQLSLLSMDPSADNVTQMEVTPSWKCQDFKVSQCIKQDKLVQS